MILRRHELQRLVDIHWSSAQKVEPYEAPSRMGWLTVDTTTHLKKQKRPDNRQLITLQLPPSYIETRKDRKSIGILLLCNHLSGIEVSALLQVDQGTVSRWQKPDKDGRKPTFNTEKTFLAAILTAKGFSEESIQAELGIKAETLAEYRIDTRWEYTFEAWSAEEEKQQKRTQVGTHPTVEDIRKKRSLSRRNSWT